MVQTTLIAWTRIFRNKGIDDPKLDPERIAAGFDKIEGELTAWPAPAEVLKAMPERPRPFFRALPRPETTEAEKANRRAFLALQAQRIAQLQRQNRDDHGPQ